MRTISAISISSYSLPPLPLSPATPHLVLWHPLENACWLLEASSGSLWCIAADGSADLIVHGCLPEVFQAQYVWSTDFYFDTARKAPVFLASTYVGEVENGLLLCEFDGQKFVPISLKKGIKTSSSDSFVFDPNRGVLVHFAGQRDMDAANDEVRGKQGGVVVRELGPDNEWRTVGKTLKGAGSYETYAGYEPRRKLSVLIDSDTHDSHGFDGKSWHSLGKLTTYPWKPNTLFADAKSGNLLFLQRQRSSDDYTAILSELTDDGWKRRDVGTLEVFGGAIEHPELGETLVFGPWFGPQTVQTTWGRYDGSTIVPTGKSNPCFSGGSAIGRASFWGGQEPGHGNYAASIRRPYSAKVVATLDGNELRWLPPSTAVIGLRAREGEHLAVGFHGEVYRLGEREWKKIAKSPSGFAERSSCLLGIDKAGRLLLIGGEPCLGTKKLNDVWLFDKKWISLSTKGSIPLSSGSFVAYDEARKVWVIAGGTVKYEPNPKTFELSEANKWSSFLTTDPASKKAPAPARFSLLAWDEVSVQMLAIAAQQFGDEPKLYIYRGDGVYDPIALLEEATLSQSVVSYDSVHRSLVFAGPELLAHLPIGDLLDEARKTAADTAKPGSNASKKRSAAKKSAAIANAVWLKLQQGDTLDFWFAKRNGTDVAIESGKRGKPAKTQSKSYKSPDEAQKAYEKAVTSKLDDGYEHAPEREACATVKGKKAYLIKLASKGEDQFGGCPPGVDAARWPVCKECECPMTHVMTLHTHADRMPLKKFAAFSIFVCCNEESAGSCETWDPDEGANAILLLSSEDLKLPALKKTPKSPKGKAASPTLKAKQIVYKETFEEDPDNENPAMPPATSKVSGYPGWIQFAATPDCSVCEKPMNFIAQVSELADDLNFAGGDSYVFCCPDEHEGRFLWQH